MVSLNRTPTTGNAPSSVSAATPFAKTPGQPPQPVGTDRFERGSAHRNHQHFLGAAASTPDPLAPAAPPEAPKPRVESSVYESSTAARQIVHGLLNAGITLDTTRGSYFQVFEQYATTPNASFFTEDPLFTRTPLKGAYNLNKPAGKVMGVLLPREFHQQPLSDQQLSDLRQRGLNKRSRSELASSSLRTARFVVGVAALSQSEHMDPEERLVFVLDSADAVTDQGRSLLAAYGANLERKLTRGTGIQSPLPPLRWSHRVEFVSGGLLFGTGAFRLANELDDALKGDSVELSTVYLGATETFGGLSSIRFSAEALHHAKQAKTAKESTQALLGYFPMSKGLRLTMSSMGTALAVTGLVTNGASVVQALNREPSPQRRDTLVSGGLGLAGSMCSLGSAVLIGATGPVGGALMVAGALFLVAQSTYEYREEIGALFKR